MLRRGKPAAGRRADRPAQSDFTTGAIVCCGRDLDLDNYRRAVPGPHFDGCVPGTVYRVAGGDVVSSAPELARLTMNLAIIHHDRTASGKRLVYGGHTIGLAAAQLTRALPALVTILGWRDCDHLGPVHEGDTLHSEITVERCEALPDGGGLAQLRSLVHATDTDGSVSDVLDWRLIGLSRDRRHSLRPQHRRRIGLRRRAARRHDARTTWRRRHPLRPDRRRPGLRAAGPSPMRAKACSGRA